METPRADRSEPHPRHDRAFGRVAGPALAALAAAAVFARTLFSEGLVWDDRIVARWQLPHFRAPADFFYPPAGIPLWETSYFRPLVTASYWAENALAPTAAASGRALAHGVNLALHALATMLLYFLARRLWAGAPRATAGAFAAALLFALHPVHAEAVCAISGRSDLLAAVFCLGATLAALRLRDGGSRALAALAALCLFLGLLSKETALMGFLALPAAWALVPRPEGEEAGRARNAVPLGAGLALAGAAYALVRGLSPDGFGAAAEALASPAWGRLLPAVAYALKQSVVPWPAQPFSPALPGVGATVAVLVIAALGVWWCARRSERRPALAFSALWFAAALAPALLAALRPHAALPMAERFLYLPSAALCLLAGGLAAGGAPRGRGFLLLAVFAALAGVFAAASLARSEAWRSDVAFWSYVSRAPAVAGHPVVLGNLAVAHRDAGRFDEARHFARQAVQTFDDPKERNKGLGLLASIDAAQARALLAAGDADGALALAQEARAGLERAVEAGLPFGPQSKATLGFCYLVAAQAARLRGAPDPALAAQAARYFDGALVAAPGDPEFSRAREQALALAQPSAR